MNNVNDVVLQGKIVYRFITPKSVVLTINTGNATKVPNYPQVVFFGELRDEIVKGFKNGDHVRILANIQSSRRTENTKDRSLLSIFGEAIEMAPSEMESAFGVESGSSYTPYINSFKLAGRISRITQLTDNLFNVTVATRKNNRLSIVTLAYYTSDPEGFKAEIAPRDEVFVLGNIQTVRKERDGEVRRFQNYVATDFKKQ